MPNDEKPGARSTSDEVGAESTSSSETSETSETNELDSSAVSEAVSEPVAAQPATHEETAASKLFVVGVGASAGGLEALGALLKGLDLASIALVVVQHLSPNYESVLSILLARSGPFEVLTVQEGMRVQANRVYVIPPNADLLLQKGVLHLVAPPDSHRHHLPIDFFFRSLAEDQGACAIGVVLSGTGSDGTFGLEAIKAAGGITFVQEPSTAKYDGMPRSALDSGAADQSLSPERIAEELVRIGKHPFLARAHVPSPLFQQGVSKLLLYIRATFGNDLAYYKPTTIERRIERRMGLHKIEKIDDYIRLVHSNGEELRSLYKDMLISVTSFFRDHDPFDALKSKVFPQVMQDKSVGAPIRIWIPACSTGEEAYSIAMCLLEYLDERAQDFRLQIFGTDIDENSIQHARQGVFPQNIALDVSPERLHRFFVKRETGEYQINRRVRDLVVFSVQNITKDAPFSRLDLASCRNLLIYLQPVMQKKVLRILHYSLNSSGFLMLGTSETVGDLPDLFSLTDRKNKIYAKKHAASALGFDIGLPSSQHPELTRPIPRELLRPAVNIGTLADRKILEMYAPPGVVINDELEVLHFRGRTSPYLEPAPGAASFNILRLVRAELHADLRRAIHLARSQKGRATVECRLHGEGKERHVRIEVVPIVEPETHITGMLVLFQEPEVLAEPSAIPSGEEPPPSLESQRVIELERDLLVTKEYLQSTVEELESSNEELKSSNEELQSSNEELQSTNEELETSKEELQSSNEELTTVNDELESRMSELQQTNDDLHNVLTGAGNAVVIIGMDLRIRRFTEMAGKMFNLVPVDVGRTVSQLNSFLGSVRIEEIAAEVIARLTPFNRELMCSDQRWYSLTVTPYKTLDHAIKGAVIVMVDIEIRKRASELGRSMTEYADSFLSVIPDPLLIVDGRLRVRWANDRYFEMFQVVAQETVDNYVRKIGGGLWSDARLSALLDGLVTTGGAFRDCAVQVSDGDRSSRTVFVSGSRLPAMAGEAVLVLLALKDERNRGAR